MEQVKKAVGSRIRAVRKTLGLTQEDLAEKASLANETISRVERGVQGATLDNYLAIAKALGINLRDLFDAADENLEKAVSKKRIRDLVSILQDRKKADVELAHDLVKRIFEHPKLKRKN